ncbi:GH21811 [Drosophila grimshawi]|uniref:GH21811 n=1 Tax=Drosophila grimshawi TaxID=7222 RepID=B4J794_DROGR|nr:GH21811 [Drosophila grimshawi]
MFCLLLLLYLLTHSMLPSCCHGPNRHPGFPNRLNIDIRALPTRCMQQQQQQQQPEQQQEISTATIKSDIETTNSFSQVIATQPSSTNRNPTTTRQLIVNPFGW